MNIAAYSSGLSQQVSQVLKVQSVYVASDISLVFRQGQILSLRPRNINAAFDMRAIFWKSCKKYIAVFNPKYTIVGMQHLMPNSISAFLQTWSFPKRLRYCSPSVCMWSLPNVSPSAYFIVGKASFLYEFWPHWTPSCMQRLLDIPWLTDHSTTAWMCDLACSEGAHHCELWAGRFPMGGAGGCVVELHQWLQFSPPGDLWSDSAGAELYRVLAGVIIPIWSGNPLLTGLCFCLWM